MDLAAGDLDVSFSDFKLLLVAEVANILAQSATGGAVHRQDPTSHYFHD